MTNYSEILKDLDVQGYCVIPNLISKKECQEYIDQIWDWMESLGTDLDRNEVATWNDEQWPPCLFGILHRLKVGHEQFIWDLRQDPRVIEVFKQIWGTDQLLVSFDGMSIIKPGKYQEKDEQTKFWAHTDQSHQKVGRHCIQGLLTLEESGPDDGGLVVWKGTHAIHQEYFQETGIETNGDWYKFSKSFISKIEREGYERIKIVAPVGSLILWDSRTIHQNESPSLNQMIPRFRYAIYLCYTPAEKASDQVLIQKKHAFYQKKMTNHWPHEVTPVMVRLPRLSRFKVSEKLPDLEQVGIKLAGLEPYD